MKLSKKAIVKTFMMLCFISPHTKSSWLPVLIFVKTECIPLSVSGGLIRPIKNLYMKWDVCGDNHVNLYFRQAEIDPVRYLYRLDLLDRVFNFFQNTKTLVVKKRWLRSSFIVFQLNLFLRVNHGQS